MRFSLFLRTLSTISRTKRCIMALCTSTSTRFTTNTLHLLVWLQNTHTLWKFLFSARELSVAPSYIVSSLIIYISLLYMSGLHSDFSKLSMRTADMVGLLSKFLSTYINHHFSYRLPLVSPTYLPFLVRSRPSRLPPHGLCQ